MGKRAVCLLLSLLLAVGLWGCTLFDEKKHEIVYMDIFDTVSEVTVYGLSAAEFEAGELRLHRVLQEYHALYDIYNPYEGINNLYTVNQAAGGDPVAVDSRILDLLEYGLEAYERTNGRVNILFGSVLSLWHESRRLAEADPDKAALPEEQALKAAAAYTDPRFLRIDRQAGTVQLTHPAARLDVGAIAKGYAVERAAAFVAEELGWEHALLSVGGNIRAVGNKGERTPFTIGIQNPDTNSALPYLLTVKAENLAVVTSGDYQRYYTVEGQRYAHIIDVETLYPATYVRSVSVLCPDSGLADVLSTALFCQPPEEGLQFLRQFPQAEAVFVLQDGSRRYSPGFEKYVLKDTGGS